MTQLGFGFDRVVGPAARKRDRRTSQNAAARATAFDRSQAGRILAELRRWKDMTAADLQRETGLTVVQICRRLPDLRKLGLIEPCEERDGFTVWRVRR